MLSFTIENNGNTIQMHCDKAGIDKLIAKLQRLKEVGHLHLWGPEQGGILSDTDPFGQPAITDVSMTTGGD